MLNFQGAGSARATSRSCYNRAVKTRPPSLEAQAWAHFELASRRYEGRGGIERATVEPGAVCNLRCPFCPTGNGELKLSRGLLTAKRFRRVLDKLGPDLKILTLFNWGESLLNPEFCDMVGEASARGIETVLHSNLSLPGFDAAKVRSLVEAGLTKLVVSCDGASQGTYERYRVGGSFDQVISNIKLLQEAKKELALERPAISWKFLVHKGNRHEIAAARKLARRLKIPVAFDRLIAPRAQAKDWEAPAKARPSSSARQSPDLCLQTWSQPTIHSDGTVLPCCVVNDPEYSLGNIFEEPFERIWNKPLVVAMRGYLKDGRRTDRKLPCYDCFHNPHRAVAG